MEPEHTGSPQSRYTELISAVGGALGGGLLLCTFSAIQKAVLGGRTLDIRSYILPAIFGALSGLMITILHRRRVKSYRALQESHRKYLNLFEGLPIGSLQVDGEGQILAANRAVTDILRYPDVDTLLSTPLGALFVQKDDYQHLCSQSKQGEKTVESEIQVQAHDQSCRWVRLRAQYGLPEGQGSQTCTMSMVDITAQRRVLAELVRLRKAVLASLDAIFMTDRQGMILFVNPAFCELYGYQAEEVVDRVTPRIIKSGQMAQNDYVAFWRTLLDKQPVVRELVNKAKDGRLLRVEGSANPILDEDGEIIGFLAIQRDVTEQRRAEEELERYAGRLEIVREIDRAILRARSPESIATATLDRIEELIPSFRTSVTLFEDDEFVILASRARGETTLLGGQRFPITSFGADFGLLRQNQVNLLHDIRELTDPSPVVRQLIGEGVRSYLNVPLLVQGELIGSLNLGHDSIGVFRQEEVGILQGLADQLAIAIQQSQLSQSNDAQRQRLTILLQISGALSSTIELESVLQVAIEQSVSALELDTGAIYLLEGEDLVLGAATPPLPAGVPDRFLRTTKSHHPHVTRAISSGAPLYLADTATTSLTPQEREISVERGLVSLLYVPLPAGQRMVGVLIMGTVGRPYSFSESEIELCQTLSVQMALAVENARLHDRIKQHADDLELMVAARTEELVLANNQLKTLTRLKDEFVSNVSHELRSPITSMRLYHDLMQVKPEKTGEYHERLGRELDRLGVLIEDLLRLTRIDQGFYILNLDEIDLRSLAEQYATDRILLAEERGLELIFDGAPDPVLITADKSALGQVLSVLITNAVNYSSPGGKVLLRVLTCPREGETWACLQVSDTGMGISDQEKDQVFDRFFRGSASRQSEAPGTGLGLAIAKGLVERQGGNIELRSPGLLGTGTTFCVWLPQSTRQTLDI